MKKSHLLKFTFILLTLAITEKTFSQEPVVLRACEMPITDEVSYTYTPFSDNANRNANNSAEPCSDIIVNFVGFDAFPEARIAFDRAVAIWENVLDSPIPIRVTATFADLGETTLGSARPDTYLTVPGQPNNVLYGSALAEQLIGEDRNGPNGTSVDIVCNFNNQADWYFGDDPNLINGTNLTDFTTVVLHELGHGLGFAGFGGQLNDDRGALRRNSTGGFFNASDGFVSIWDTFTIGRDVVSREFSITDNTRFPDPSNTLLGAYTNNDLTINSPEAMLENNGVQPNIFAPTTFNSGSSYSHWDESTFNGTIDALMTPQVAREEVVRSVGPITQAFLKDMGWTLCEDSTLNTNEFTLNDIEISPNPFMDKIEISIGSANVNDLFKVSLYDIKGRVIINKSYRASEGKIYLNNLNGLKASIYFLKIAGSNSQQISRKVIKM